MYERIAIAFVGAGALSFQLISPYFGLYRAHSQILAYTAYECVGASLALTLPALMALYSKILRLENSLLNSDRSSRRRARTAHASL
jgi:hypothetical protein